LVLTLVLAESAVELVPKEIHGHSSIRGSAERKKKSPGEILLDQSYHHAAMLGLPGKGVGRGRPDIVHTSLLLALDSPLNMTNELQCYVHTRDNCVIKVSPNTRLPRNTERFVSLLEQLYSESRVPKDGDTLMSLKTNSSLEQLLSGLNPNRVIALTTTGVNMELSQVTKALSAFSRPVILIGGFQKGHFSTSTLQLADAKYCIDSKNLEASTVVARTLYDYEKAIGLQRF
jgi:rRNA small subunit pseudouridine methyltransferase Nep1